MTSLERKTRAVNSRDIASQFANSLGKDTPVKKLKSKNSELLSKYREKLKDETESDRNEINQIDNEAADVERQNKPLPKVLGSFKGVNFDEKEVDTSEGVRQENKKRTWRKNTNGPRKNFDNENKGKGKFKPFKRRNNNNGKKFTQNERF
jgi:hypothetical protein